MKAIIKKSILKGTINAIPSKSYVHRYIIGSFLSSGISIIKNAFCFGNNEMPNDIYATLECVKSLGASYEINGCDIKIFSINIKIFLKNIANVQKKPFMLNAYESGSTLRFLIPIALSLYDDVYFKGTSKLMDRGIDVYNDIFSKNNIIVSNEESDANNKLIRLKGKLKAGNYKIDGSLSSQFITGLLFSLPLLDGNSTLEVTKPILSKPYIDITLDVLKQFNIKIDVKDNIFYINGNQKYKCGNFVTEGDYSNAAFIDAYNYFENNITINNLNMNSLQGDMVYKKYFDLLAKENVTLDISNCIDLGPILFVFACLMHGATFIGCKRLKIKESNRLDDMLLELKKVGVEYKIGTSNDIVNIKATNIKKYANICFYSHNDHRIVMALTLILTLIGGEIDGIEAVKKSYPNFFKDLSLLGLNAEME